MSVSVVNPLQLETVWTDKWRVDDAERKFYERLAGTATGGQGADSGVNDQIERLEKENQHLKKAQSELTALMKKLEIRVQSLERSSTTPGSAKKVESEEEDDDDVDLFGSDDEEDTAAAEKLKQERVAAYTAKKSKKPALIAKSSIVLDVKPWEDTTDMKEMEKLVRSIQMDGLLWGAAKLVPVGYGIKKLQIGCVVEDDKVSMDDLEEKITAFEDHVQSIDIAAFNKI